VEPFVFEPPTEVQRAPKLPTVPESPMLRTKERSSVRKAMENSTSSNNEEMFVFKARPLPTSAPFRPKPAAHHLTEPLAFALRFE
jgi:hypothetical protein